MTKTEATKRAIRAALYGHGHTQEWLAAKLGISSGALSKILSGYLKASPPVADEIHRLTGVEVPCDRPRSEVA